MAIQIIYTNIDSARRNMRKRGITYRENCAPHRAREQTGRHFDLDSAHVVRWTDRAEVNVTYTYFNRCNEPKSARGVA